jgi:hypothetical protein
MHTAVRAQTPSALGHKLRFLSMQAEDVLTGNVRVVIMQFGAGSGGSVSTILHSHACQVYRQTTLLDMSVPSDRDGWSIKRARAIGSSTVDLLASSYEHLDHAISRLSKRNWIGSCPPASSVKPAECSASIEWLGVVVFGEQDRAMTLALDAPSL